MSASLSPIGKRVLTQLTEHSIEEKNEEELHAETLEKEAASYLKFDEDTKTIELTSPATGKVLRIPNVKAKIGTSGEGLADLKKIEEEVIGMSCLPDFGYAQDNYLLERGDPNSNKW